MDVSDLARHGAKRRRHRGLSRARLELPHDRHAGGARPLPARAARRDPRRAHGARPSATPRRSSAIPYLEPPYEPDYAERTWQSYAVRLAPDAPIGRTELMRRLLRDGVATRRGVMAIHRGAGLRRRLRSHLPHTEAATRDSLMLPLFAGLTDEQQDHVIDCLAAHVGGRGGMSGPGADRPRPPDAAAPAHRGAAGVAGARGRARARTASSPPGSGRLPIAARGPRARGGDRRGRLGAAGAAARRAGRAADRRLGLRARRARARAATRRCSGIVSALEQAGHTLHRLPARPATAGRSSSTRRRSARGGPGCRPRCATPPTASRTPTRSSPRRGRPRTRCSPRPRAARASTSSRTSSRPSTRRAAMRCWPRRPTASASTASPPGAGSPQLPARDYGMPADHFDFGRDLDLRARSRRRAPSERTGVCFYSPARDAAPGATSSPSLALDLFAERHPEVDIHLFGRAAKAAAVRGDRPRPAARPEQLNELYNRCVAGPRAVGDQRLARPARDAGRRLHPGRQRRRAQPRSCSTTPHVAYAPATPFELADALCRARRAPAGRARAAAEAAAASVRGSPGTTPARPSSGSSARSSMGVTRAPVAAARCGVSRGRPRASASSSRATGTAASSRAACAASSTRRASTSAC